MKYYKSDKPVDQMEEAITKLRRVIIKKHAKYDSKYKKHEALMTKTSIKGFGAKANLYTKIKKPGDYEYKISQYVRNWNDIRKQNDEIISKDFRMELAESIKNVMSELKEEQAEIGVFAIEQILQDQGNLDRLKDLEVPYRFTESIDRIRIGIRKLGGENRKKEYFLSFASRIEELYAQAFYKLKYMKKILEIGRLSFDENSEGIKELEELEEEIIEEHLNWAIEERADLREKVKEELRECGITTEFNTLGEVILSKLVNGVKIGFSKLGKKIASKNDVEGVSEKYIENEEDSFSDRRQKMQESLKEISLESRFILDEKEGGIEESIVYNREDRVD